MVQRRALEVPRARLAQVVHGDVDVHGSSKNANRDVQEPVVHLGDVRHGVQDVRVVQGRARRVGQGSGAVQLEDRVRSNVQGAARVAAHVDVAPEEWFRRERV